MQSFLLIFLTFSLLLTSFAQSAPPQKRKPTKDFGSSLKRLKWNSEKNRAIDVNDGEQGQDLNEGDVIRIETSLVTCDLLVMDQHGKPVNGLTAGDFSITEDGEPQTVGHFLTGDNVSVPRTIVLIIDYSGSQFPYLRNSVQAAKVLVDKLGPKDLVAIVTDDVELLLDFTSDKKKLNEKLDSLLKRTHLDQPYFGFSGGRVRPGRSLQYSALLATLTEAFSEEDMRPIIIFQTDGDEVLSLRNPVMEPTLMPGLTGQNLVLAEQNLARHRELIKKAKTQFSLDDLYRAVEKSRATVYTVIPGMKLMGLSPDAQLEKVKLDRMRRRREMLERFPPAKANMKQRFEEGGLTFTVEQDRWTADHMLKMQSALAGVASLTGGWTEFLETPEEADAIYARIFSDINQRYRVGYYPVNKTRDGKRRKIEFEVKGHPDYEIYGRRSYFAPSK